MANSAFHPSGVDYAVVTTTTFLRFDGRSTAHQRSLRSSCRNASAAADSLAAVALTYLFRPQCSSSHTGQNVFVEWSYRGSELTKFWPKFGSTALETRCTNGLRVSCIVINLLTTKYILGSTTRKGKKTFYSHITLSTFNVIPL